MPIAGKLEVVIKINELPKSEIVEHTWRRFFVECDGKIISITVKPKVWNKLEAANEQFSLWVAAIAGTMGRTTRNGFILDNPAIQVFERKPKESKSS
ncbi:fertility inhibition FinO-like protein [Leptolyngbya sp. DQ-M1]|uniref:fertility inhibition FinO-like protein n=1 Tax=Leptolyngbya sp. DQ-M1 TaxID=2933920 RepID=UPI00329A4BE3